MVGELNRSEEGVGTFTTADLLARGRRALALLACLGIMFGITACSSDASKLSCKDLSSNPAGADAMAKVAMRNPALAPYVNPSNNFGGGGQEAAGAGVDEGGLTNEFKNQISAICSGASSSTQPFETALANTESFARTGTRKPASSAPHPAGQGSSESSSAPDSGQSAGSSSQGSGGSSGGGGSGQGSGGGGTAGSGSGGAGGSQPSGSQGSSSPSGGSPSSGSNGSESSGSGGGGSGNGGSGGSGSGSSGNGGSNSGNSGIPPCQPPSCAY